MSSKPEIFEAGWNEFVNTVLKPQGLTDGLNGDTNPLKRFFSLRLAGVRGDPASRQEVQQEMLRWNQEMESKDPDFFQRREVTLGAITVFVEGQAKIRPGMIRRGGKT